jgi:voltage-gated potassium channel
MAKLSLHSPTNGRNAIVINGEIALDPRGRIRLVIEVVVIALLAGQTFLIPLGWAFPVLSEESDLWCAFDVLTDAVFIFDIGIGCITAYFNDEMLLVTCRSSIIKHYANGPLFGDLIAAIPLLSVCRWTALPQSVTILKLGKFLGFLGPKKGGILPGKSALFKKLQNSPFVQKFAQLCILIMVFFGFMHYEACIFFYLGSRSNDKGEANWISDAGIQDDRPGDQYWTAIYFAVTTVTTVGYGDISPVSKDERVFVSVMMLCATILHAVVFGSVTTTVLDMNKKRKKVTEHLEKVNLFMAHCKLPPILQVKIREFYEYKFERAGKHGMNQMDDLTSELPQLLSSRIVDHIHFAIRQNNPVLNIFPSHLWRMIVRAAKEHIYAPHDYVYIQGEAIRDFFVIKQGRVGLEDTTGELLTVFGDSAFFGELELFGKIAVDMGYNEEGQDNARPKGATPFDSLMYLQGNTKRAYSVATLGYCELYSVALEDLDLAFSEPEFDEARHLLCEVAFHRDQACKKKIRFDDAKVISKALERYSDHAIKRKNISASSVKQRQAFITHTPPLKSERRFGSWNQPGNNRVTGNTANRIQRRKSSDGATAKIFAKGNRNAVAPAAASEVLVLGGEESVIDEVVASLQVDTSLERDDEGSGVDEASREAGAVLAARAVHSLATMEDTPPELMSRFTKTFNSGMNEDELMQLWKHQELRRRRSIALAETKLSVMKKRREETTKAVTNVASKLVGRLSRTRQSGSGGAALGVPRTTLT